MSITDATVLRLVASMLWTDGNVAQNVFNAVVTGAGSPWDEEDIIDDLEDWLDDMYLNIAGNISENLDPNELVVYKYDSVDDDWDEVGSQAWTYTFTQTSQELPRGVAALVRLWTTDPDVQGKKYIPGLTEIGSDSGLWVAQTITNLLAFAADWYTPFTGAASGATFTPGIWSVKGKVFKAGVNHVATSTIPAYQRRRKRNVGI